MGKHNSTTEPTGYTVVSATRYTDKSFLHHCELADRHVSSQRQHAHSTNVTKNPVPSLSLAAVTCCADTYSKYQSFEPINCAWTTKPLDIDSRNESQIADDYFVYSELRNFSSGHEFWLRFSVRTSGDARLLLTTDMRQVAFEVILCHKGRSEIRHGVRNRILISGRATLCPDSKEYRNYWIHFDGHVISLGRGDPGSETLLLKALSVRKVHRIAVGTSGGGVISWKDVCTMRKLDGNHTTTRALSPFPSISIGSANLHHDSIVVDRDWMAVQDQTPQSDADDASAMALSHDFNADSLIIHEEPSTSGSVLADAEEVDCIDTGVHQNPLVTESVDMNQ